MAFDDGGLGGGGARPYPLSTSGNEHTTRIAIPPSATNPKYLIFKYTEAEDTICLDTN